MANIKRYEKPDMAAPIGVQIMFNDDLYERCKQVATLMSKARGITPPHLIDCGEACFAVVLKALTWKLDPYSVAASTFQIQGGKIGYEGKLVQAILENSGALEPFELEGFEGGLVQRKYIGDWERVRAKFLMKKSDKGKDYPVPNWPADAEEGLGIIIAAKVKGEVEPRQFTFWMKEAYPRFSTLWAIRPSQQIHYTAVRAFANVVAPGLFMGVPFETDMDEMQSGMINVTPKRGRDEDHGGATRLPSPYEAGRQARQQGLDTDVAPNGLNTEQYRDWMRGWREEDTAMTEAADTDTHEVADDAKPEEPAGEADETQQGLDLEGGPGLTDYELELKDGLDAALDMADIDQVEKAYLNAPSGKIANPEVVEDWIQKKRDLLKRVK
jgi:hypothetical protein